MFGVSGGKCQVVLCPSLHDDGGGDDDDGIRLVVLCPPVSCVHLCPPVFCVQSTRAWNFWGVSAIWGEIPCCPSAGGGELHDNPSFNSPIFVFVCFLFVFVYFLFVFVYLSTGLGAAGGESHGSPSLNSPVGRSHCSVTESPPSSILFCKTENFGVSFKNVNLFEKKCVWKERRTCQLIFLFWKYLSEI